MSKTGEVPKLHTFVFDDGEFSFHTAHWTRDEASPQARPSSRIFRVPVDTWPSIIAGKQNIQYKLLLNSTAEEIALWMSQHPDQEVKKVLEHNVRY